ncbi:MAG: hypothetical protein HYU98_05290, partial [Deltaproteobacteria bacterium]|nr:hypothetical protein [Deltaproteobacteria bacterium]
MGETFNTDSVVNSLLSEQFKADTTSYNISKNANNQTVESIEVTGTAFNARLHRLLSDDLLPVGDETYIEYQSYDGNLRRMIAFDGNPPCDPEILKRNLCNRSPYIEINDDLCTSTYDDLSRCNDGLEVLYGDEGRAVSMLFADTAMAAAKYYSS